MTIRSRGWVLCVLGALAFAACDAGSKGESPGAEEKSKKKKSDKDKDKDKDKKEAPSATAAAASVAAPTPVPAAANPGASNPATEPAVEPSAQPAVEPNGWFMPEQPSKAPSVAEWDGAPNDSGPTARALGCEVKFVREWIRVSCRSSPGDQNPIKGVTLLTPSRKPAGYLDFVRTDSVASFIYAIRSTTDMKVQFNWAAANRTLTLKYNQGAPKPVVSFDSGLPGDTSKPACSAVCPGGLSIQGKCAGGASCEAGYTCDGSNCVCDTICNPDM
jgi:hypothetical protein